MIIMDAVISCCANLIAKLKLTFSSADSNHSSMARDVRECLWGQSPAPSFCWMNLRNTEMCEKSESNISQKAKTDGNGRLMSIREVSALTDVPPHTIRFWEKEMPNILCPARTPGGQRRYDAEMAERIRMIKRLSNEKRYSLATIREYLSATEGFSRIQSDAQGNAQAEHAIQLIVDEITEVLKERLMGLLRNGI